MRVVPALMMGVAVASFSTNAEAKSFFKHPKKWVQQTSKWVERHPVETIVIVGAVATGGAMLAAGTPVVFTATIGGVTVPVTSVTASGAVVGVGVGAGVAASSQQQSAPKSSSAQVQPTMVPSTPLPPKGLDSGVPTRSSPVAMSERSSSGNGDIPMFVTVKDFPTATTAVSTNSNRYTSAFFPEGTRAQDMVQRAALPQGPTMKQAEGPWLGVDQRYVPNPHDLKTIMYGPYDRRDDRWDVPTYEEMNMRTERPPVVQTNSLQK